MAPLELSQTSLPFHNWFPTPRFTRDLGRHIRPTAGRRLQLATSISRVFAYNGAVIICCPKAAALPLLSR